MKKGIFVGVPSYEGKICVDTSEALLREVYAAFEKKYPYVPFFHQQNMMSAKVRNFMVQTFLESDDMFTDMVFVDWDVSWPTGTLCRLVEHPVDCVGASYPFRADPLDFPMAWLPDDELWAIDPKTGERSDTGLLEVSGIPTGCLRLSRHMLQTLVDKHPELEYYEPALKGKKAYALFEWVRRDKTIFTEDYAFCYLAREAGFKIWLDPDIDMCHTGIKQFKGNIGSWLRSRTAISMDDKINNILKFNEENRV